MARHKKKELPSILPVHNQLARSRSALSATALKILFLMCKRIVQQKSWTSVSFSIKELSNALGVTYSTGYEHLLPATRELIQAVIEIPNSLEGRKQFNVMSVADYKYEEGIVEMKLNDEMMSLVQDLQIHFTKMNLDILMKIKGEYATRFYMHICSYNPRVETNALTSFEMTDGQLRSWLIIEELYQEQKILKRDVINRAKKELDAKADLTFEHTPKKEGRKVVGHCFEVKENMPKIAPKKRKKSATVEEQETFDFGKELAVWLNATLEQKTEWVKNWKGQNPPMVEQENLTTSQVFELVETMNPTLDF